MKTFPIPTKSEPSKRASAFFDAVGDTLSNLYGRWQDEKEYEDINDYKLPFVKRAAEYGVQIVKMNTRPFGFNFIADSREYQIKATASKIEYVRVK